MIYTGNCLDILPTLPEKSIQCCVTSPPYWGLRDYGVDGQLGLEKTPEEYTAKMVAVFREVKRVLRDDGVLWLNLGTSMAGSGARGSNPGGPSEKQQSNRGSWTVGLGGILPNQSRSDAQSCGNGGKVPQDFQADDRVCLDSGDGFQDANPIHHSDIFRNDQFALQDAPLISQITHDNEPGGCGQVFPDALLHGARESTTEQFSGQSPGVCAPEATAWVSPSGRQIEPDFVQECERKTVCTSDIVQKLGPLAVRKRGKESFFSACNDPFCKGLGKCGLCWVNLTIPFLNVKAKDEINIPHLVAMALQADGWVLRQTIIWAKPNPMPESVTDRCTKAHEYIFLLTKSAKYFYDAAAVKEDSVTSEEMQIAKRNIQPHKGQRDNGMRETTGGFDKIDKTYATRNRRSVWTITTKPYKEAHFATFPPELPTLCIKAGSKIGDTVLDPFSGAGTVGYVCEKLDRKYIGIELNPKYSAMADDRIYNVAPLFHQEAL